MDLETEPASRELLPSSLNDRAKMSKRVQLPNKVEKASFSNPPFVHSTCEVIGGRTMKDSTRKLKLFLGKKDNTLLAQALYLNTLTRLGLSNHPVPNLLTYLPSR